MMKCISVTVSFLMCTHLVHHATSSTIADQRQSQYQKDAANNIGGQTFSQENHQADKVNENQSGVFDNKNTNYVGAKDTGQYTNLDYNKKILDDNKYFGGQNFNHDSGDRSHGLAIKKGHKKGHHNSGFRNSYHKDESSNNSSYFDEYNDEGDQSDIQRGRGRYGNEANRRYDQRKEDGMRHIQDNGRHGGYDRRGDSDYRNNDHRDYDRKNYQAHRKDYGQNQQGQGYSGRDREFSRADVAPYPHGVPVYPEYPPRPYSGYRKDYYDLPPRPATLPPPLPPPLPHPNHELRRHDLNEIRGQTITIYEDPRIEDPYRDSDILGDNSGYIQLDVRPSHQRFQRYGSYYEPRRDWGINRRSDINPLVFNYHNRY